MAILPKSKFTDDEIGLLKLFGRVREEVSMKGTAFQNAVAQFQAKKIKEMQTNLATSKRVSSRRLSQSLVPAQLEVDDNGDILIEWEGEKYAKFIDQGVNGLERKFGSAYSFNRPIKVKAPESDNFYTSIRDWMKFRGINSVNFKDQNGHLQTKYLKTEKDRRQGAFALIKTIQKNGISPSHFIEDAFKNESGVLEDFTNILMSEWQKPIE